MSRLDKLYIIQWIIYMNWGLPLMKILKRKFVSVAENKSPPCMCYKTINIQIHQLYEKSVLIAWRYGVVASGGECGSGDRGADRGG